METRIQSDSEPPTRTPSREYSFLLIFFHQGARPAPPTRQTDPEDRQRHQSLHLHQPAAGWLRNHLHHPQPAPPGAQTHTLQRDVHHAHAEGKTHMALQHIPILARLLPPTGQIRHYISAVPRGRAPRASPRLLLLLNIPLKILFPRFSPSSCTPSSEGSSTPQSGVSMLPCKCTA